MFGFTKAVRSARERVVGIQLVDSFAPCIGRCLPCVLSRLTSVAVAVAVTGDKLSLRGWRLAVPIAILWLRTSTRKRRHGHACLLEDHCFLLRAQHASVLASAIPASGLDVGIGMEFDCDLAREGVLDFGGIGGR